MTTMIVRDTSLYVDVVGRGDPVLLMHGGPGLDHSAFPAHLSRPYAAADRGCAGHGRASDTTARRRMADSRGAGVADRRGAAHPGAA